jgi:antitoxin component YwqK of YwqJK toxin-antitoxin module
LSETKQVEALSLLEGRIAHIAVQPGGFTGVIGHYRNGNLHFNYPMSNGKFHGLCRVWHENGILAVEENYEYGQHMGWRRAWYPSGKIESESFYGQEGVEGTVSEWYQDEVLKSQIHYLKGKGEGPQQEWHKNGTLKCQSLYIRGILNGMKTVWYPSGKINSQSPFVNGLLHGARRVWDEDGQLISKTLYIRGVLANPEIQNLLSQIKTGEFQARDIIKIRNVAARRIILEEFGYERFLAQLEHEILDVDGDSELVRIDWRKDEEPVYLVKVKCPSTGVFYALRVPPRMKTVKQSVAWTFGMKKNEYNPIKEA